MSKYYEDHGVMKLRRKTNPIPVRQTPQPVEEKDIEEKPSNTDKWGISAEAEATVEMIIERNKPKKKNKKHKIYRKEVRFNKPEKQVESEYQKQVEENRVTPEITEVLEKVSGDDDNESS